MTFTESVEAEIRKNEETIECLERQMHYLAHAVDNIKLYIVFILADKDVSDPYDNNWNDAQDALHCLSRIKKRTERACNKINSLNEFYEYELSK